jgi:hypothetical protein
VRVTPDARPHFLVTSVVLAVISLVASSWLMPHRPEPGLEEPPAFALPSRAVLPIGLIGGCAVFTEEAGLDWSAMYVHTVLGQPASTAALTVSAFSISMAGVASIAYGSGLIAPGIIGGIARLSSLTVSFALVIWFTAAIAIGAGVLRPPTDR